MPKDVKASRMSDEASDVTSLAPGHSDVASEVDEIIVEQPLLTIKETFVYKVPPLRASSGHRAEEWGLAHPVFTGILKVVQVGDSCCVRLFKSPPDAELGAAAELFAQCEITLDRGRTLQSFVEAVIDSSRYFVLRCEDKTSGRHAYVGVGFRERSSAFDLKAVLDEFARFLDRQKKAEQSSAYEGSEVHDGSDAGPVKQMKDLSIAEGQKLHLKVMPGNGPLRSRRRPQSSDDPLKKGSKTGLLPPPPLPGASYAASSSLASPTPITPPPSSSPPGSETPPSSSSAIPLPSVGDSSQQESVERPVPLAHGEGVKYTSGVETGDGGATGVDEDDGWGEFESA